MSGKPASEDDCLNCIGKVSHNASTVDMILCNVFRVISGFDSEIAISIYYTPDASTVKFGLITNLMKIHCDKEEQELIRGIIKKATKTNKIRNELAHSFLHISHTHGLQRVRPRDEQPRKRVTVTGLQASTDATKNYVIQANQLFGRLCEKRGVPIQLQF